MISTSFSTATLVQYYKQAVRKKSCYIHTRLISELSLLGYLIHLYVPEAIQRALEPSFIRLVNLTYRVMQINWYQSSCVFINLILIIEPYFNVR